LNSNYRLQKAYGSYDVVIGRFLCFSYTVIVRVYRARGDFAVIQYSFLLRNRNFYVRTGSNLSTFDRCKKLHFVLWDINLNFKFRICIRFEIRFTNLCLTAHAIDAARIVIDNNGPVLITDKNAHILPFIDFRTIVTRMCEYVLLWYVLTGSLPLYFHHNWEST
jgi:hypothetical protein